MLRSASRELKLEIPAHRGGTMIAPKKPAQKVAHLDGRERSAKTARPLGDRLAARLSQYGLAAVAAAVGTLGAVPAARAGIIYTPIDKSYYDRSVTLDLNMGSTQVIGFDFVGYTRAFSGGWFGNHGVQVQDSGLDGVLLGRNGSAAPLPAGYGIGGNRRFGATANLEGGHFFEICEPNCITTGGNIGPWLDKTAYLGLEFTFNSQVYYGWMEVSLTGWDARYTYTLDSWAWDTTPGQAIYAGQTSADAGSLQAAPTPEPGTLGLLALGSLGLGFWRRKRAS
jgi:PEP-CTERM motif